MTLVLNVKPGDEDYSDTSFLLRQASPYMKIKYTNLVDSSDLVSQKRSNVSLICQESKKKRKVHKPEVLVVEQKENDDTDAAAKVSERGALATDEAQHKFLNSELQRVSRSEEIMTNFAKALWTVLKQYKHKLMESENAAETMKELIRDKDTQIMELKRKLEVLNSCCSCKNFPIVRDAPGVQDDTVSSGGAAPSQPNQPDLCDATTDNFHFVVEAEESTCSGPHHFPTNCELEGKSVIRDTLAVSSVHEQEQTSRDFEPEKSCSPGASGLKFDSESENIKAGVPVAHKELDSSGNFIEETSSLSCTARACIHSDNPSDQGLTVSAGHHTIPNGRTERVSQSPQFTSCNKKSTKEQSDEELSMTAVDDIQHDIVTEVMHPDCTSSSQQVKPDTEDVSSIQSSLKQQGMKKSEEVEIEFERCEPAPAVEDSLLNHGCSGGPGRTSAKALIVVMDSEAEDVGGPLVPRPSNPKRKTRRRLQPVAGMMLKEFGSTGMEDMDTKREDRSNKSCSGRSDVLIKLLKKGRRARA